MARWLNGGSTFPAPLRDFREEDWPPVEGECLQHYACRGQGYGADCVPRDGEFCGQLHYEHMARELGSRQLAAAKRADACERFHQARLNWLGEDHPLWFGEFLDGCGVRHAMKYRGGGG
ncbi:MAG TPA: hypothetical protein VFQ68_16420 [Streptosporangiaceae bacterium]|nr:hypothetical protein [Streptosporangiaceae bacterium]